MLLHKYKALAIFGKPGCGKTTLAKNIARNGSWRTCNILDLSDRFGLGRVIGSGIGTVIVECFSGKPEELAIIKQLVSEDEAMVDRKGQDPRLEKLPCFIFCLDSEPVGSFLNGRLTTIHIK